jgi:hypothetical protein
MERKGEVAATGMSTVGPSGPLLTARHLLLCLLAISRISYAQHEGGAGDFLIVEKMDKLVIYNKYQQAPDSLERAALVSFIPMRIMAANDVLSDGFTACMKVEIHGELFYLPKDEQGSLIGYARAGFSKVFNHVSLLRDTVQILQDRAITFSLPDHSRQRFLRKTDSYARAFRQGSSTYGALLGRRPTYGWVTLTQGGEGREWRIHATPRMIEAKIPDRIVKSVEAKLEDVNGVLKQLYRYFNDRTHQHRQAPQWHIVTSDWSIICILEPPLSGNDRLESTQKVIKDLENILLGTPLKIYSAPGRIEIR